MPTALIPGTLENASVPDCSLDDVMVETKDESESSVRLELLRVIVQHGLEQINVAGSNG